MSGSEGSWLERFPPHWRIIPLWVMFRREKRTGFVEEPMVSVFRELGVIFKDSLDNQNVTAEDRSIYQLVEPGWLVVNRMKAWQGSVGVSEVRGISSGHYLCFRPTHHEDGRFLNWLLRSSVYAHAYLLESRGVRPGQAEIDNDRLRLLPVVLPPLSEQQAIADFLDRETAKIDALIEKQTALTERLRERRVSVISEALGAADAADGRPALKHHVRSVRQGWSPQCDAVPGEIDEWAVLKAGCANGGRFRPDENKRLPAALDPRPETVVQQGDIIISRANTRELVGSAAVVMTDHPKLMLSDKLYAFRMRAEANPEFVAMLLQTPRYRELIELTATGTSPSMQNTTRADIGNLPMRLPSRGHQDDLVRVANRETAKIDALIAKAERFVEVARERRSALITAAVTGQLDIGVRKAS